MTIFRLNFQHLLFLSTLPCLHLINIFFLFGLFYINNIFGKKIFPFICFIQVSIFYHILFLIIPFIIIFINLIKFEHKLLSNHFNFIFISCKKNSMILHHISNKFQIFLKGLNNNKFSLQYFFGYLHYNQPHYAMQSFVDYHIN